MLFHTFLSTLYFAYMRATSNRCCNIDFDNTFARIKAPAKNCKRGHIVKWVSAKICECRRRIGWKCSFFFRLSFFFFLATKRERVISRGRRRVFSPRTVDGFGSRFSRRGGGREQEEEKEEEDGGRGRGAFRFHWEYPV